MPSYVPTKEEFDQLVTVVNELAGKIELADEMKPLIKAILEWLASKLNGKIIWR